MYIVAAPPHGGSVLVHELVPLSCIGASHGVLLGPSLPPTLHSLTRLPPLPTTTINQAHFAHHPSRGGARVVWCCVCVPAYFCWRAHRTTVTPFYLLLTACACFFQSTQHTQPVEITQTPAKLIAAAAKLVKVGHSAAQAAAAVLQPLSVPAPALLEVAPLLQPPGALVASPTLADAAGDGDQGPPGRVQGQPARRSWRFRTQKQHDRAATHKPAQAAMSGHAGQRTLDSAHLTAHT